MSARGTSKLELRAGASILDVTAFFRRFTWTESMLRGGFSWTCAFDTDEWPAWQDFLIGAEGLGQQRFFRITTTEDDIESTTDWRFVLVDTSRSSIRGESLVARVSGGDRRLLMMQKARTRAWPGTSISEVLTRTALEYDLTPDVEDTAVHRDRWQIREDDWTYMSRLASDAANASGRGDVYLWLDEKTLRLRAPNLTVPSARKHDLAEVENRIDRAIVDYHGRAIDRRGGATLRAVGYDLDAQAPLRFDVDAGAADTMPALASRVPRDPAGGVRVTIRTEETIGGVEGGARAEWGRAAPRYFSLRTDGRPDPTLRPGTILELHANIDAKRNAPFFGRYVVLEVQHRFAGGACTTTAACYRREAFEGDVVPTGSSAAAGGTRDRTRFGLEDRPSVLVVAEEIP